MKTMTQEELKEAVVNGKSIVGQLRGAAEMQGTGVKACAACGNSEVLYHILHGANEGQVVCPNCLRTAIDTKR